jgi:hypothetical protein
MISMLFCQVPSGLEFNANSTRRSSKRGCSRDLLIQFGSKTSSSVLANQIRFCHHLLQPISIVARCVPAHIMEQLEPEPIINPSTGNTFPITPAGDVPPDPDGGAEIARSASSTALS